MSEIDQVRRRMAHRSARQVAIGAGVHPHSLYKIIKKTSNPKYETVKKVLDYLNKIDGAKNG